jgi:hypothetical protein
VRFRANDRFLWSEYLPPATYRTRDGAHPALALIMLDELGWWLGALAQKECGVTTDVRITLFEALPFAPLLVLGDRAVESDGDPRGRYSRTHGVVLAQDGRVLAAAEVRFGGSRAYTRRLVEPFLATGSVDDLVRWFPRIRELVRDESTD